MPMRRDVMTRRDFVAYAGVCAAGGAGALAAAPAAAPATNSKRWGAAGVDKDGLTELSAAEAVERMRRGELTSEAYAEGLLERCAALKSLNAFITLEPERVLRDARAADRARAKGGRLGPLHGLPIPVKDSLNTQDYPTTAGTRALEGFRPAADAPLVAKLKAAGAIVLGKTNLHELAYGWTSNNHAFGAVHNPYDPSRIPGGSSGGTAAAVAAHMAPLGVAADTEGSIRVPAALCGLVGFRPTTGRYSQEGLAPISPVFDQAGPHARTMRDVSLFDAAVTGDDRPVPVPDLREVRLAVYRGYYFQGLDPEVARVAEAALAKLEAAGVTLIETEMPDLADLIGRITGPVQYHDTEPAFRAYLAKYQAGVTFEQLVAQTSEDIHATLAQYVLPGGKDVVSEAAYRKVIDRDLPHLKAMLRETYERTRTTAIVFPATLTTAPRIGEEGLLSFGGRQVPFDVAMSRNIDPGSTAGLSCLVLPAGLAANGLPVALEFDGPSGSDRAMLGLGQALERVLGAEPPPRL